MGNVYMMEGPNTTEGLYSKVRDHDAFGGTLSSSRWDEVQNPSTISGEDSALLP